MKRFRLPFIMGLIMIFSVMPAFAGTPSITSVVSSLPNLTGGRPLKDISTVDPALTEDTMLINKLNDPNHLPKFVVNDPYGTLSKVQVAIRRTLLQMEHGELTSLIKLTSILMILHIFSLRIILSLKASGMTRRLFFVRSTTR